MKRLHPLAVSAVLGPILFGFSVASSMASYQIQKGDTLTKIALSKYGSMEKWKDLFELNKNSIKDPHWIYPGQRLRLMTDEDLTLVASTHPTLPKIKKHSQEFRLLPLQSWEQFVIKPDPYVDPSGFDKRSSVGNRFTDKTLATLAVTPDRIPIVGEITGARNAFEFIPLGETVFIRSDEAIQVGTTYSITSGPEKMTSSRDGRVGFAYPIHGKLKVLGVRDGLFMGTIIGNYSTIYRGDLLIPNTQTLKFIEPIPCPTPLNATILLPKSMHEEMIGTYKLVLLDVGVGESVKPGMIFRQYLQADPLTQSKITSRDFLIESELQILSAHEQFSIAIILASRSGVKEGQEVVGLTDLKDFQQNQGMQGVLQEHVETPTVNDLDRMDTTDGVGEKEDKELKQLETWTKQTPSEGTGQGLPVDDEIKMEPPRKGSKPPKDLGEEVAPNDSSAEPIKTPPATAPEDQPAPPPDATGPTEPTPPPALPPPPSQPPSSDKEVQPETQAPAPTIDSAIDSTTEAAPLTP